MTNLIELITHIHEEEALDFQGNLEENQKDRILHLILQKQKNNTEIPTAFHNKSAVDNYKTISSNRSFVRKRLIIAILTAALLFGMAAFAANDGQWDIRLMEFWHLTDTTYLKGGNVLIDKSSTSNDLTLTALSSIGDKNNVSILLETDYAYDNMPKNSLEKEDFYFNFDTAYVSISDKNGAPSSGWGSIMESFSENGKLYFLLTITCKDINRKKVNITCKDLYMYEESSEDKILINDGIWNLEWTYQYKSNVKYYYPFAIADCGEEKILITKIEVTPLSIRVTGIANYFHKNHIKTMTGTIRNVYGKDMQELVEFTSTGYGSKYNMFLEWNIVLNAPLENTELSGIQIGETVVEFH
ncbi:MAG: hypothetical protein NC412_01805 [Roseburia sp.]|nr:hypothetical protein [Roseburia sp.]MCM1277992.1 hypothetical protein [Robinsoniella sp.]